MASNKRRMSLGPESAAKVRAVPQTPQTTKSNGSVYSAYKTGGGIQRQRPQQQLSVPSASDEDDRAHLAYQCLLSTTAKQILLKRAKARITADLDNQLSTLQSTVTGLTQKKEDAKSQVKTISTMCVSSNLLEKSTLFATALDGVGDDLSGLHLNLHMKTNQLQTRGFVPINEEKLMRELEHEPVSNARIQLKHEDLIRALSICSVLKGISETQIKISEEQESVSKELDITLVNSVVGSCDMLNNVDDDVTV